MGEFFSLSLSVSHTHIHVHAHVHTNYMPKRKRFIQLGLWGRGTQRSLHPKFYLWYPDKAFHLRQGKRYVRPAKQSRSRGAPPPPSLTYLPLSWLQSLLQGGLFCLVRSLCGIFFLESNSASGRHTAPSQGNSNFLDFHHLRSLLA